MIEDIPTSIVDEFVELTEEAFVSPWGFAGKLRALNSLSKMRDEIRDDHGHYILYQLEKHAAKKAGTYVHMFKSL